MKREEQVTKNLELARRFFGRLLDHPLEAASIAGSPLVLIPRDDPELAEANRALASRLAAAESGRGVSAVEVAENGAAASETLVSERAGRRVSDA